MPEPAARLRGDEILAQKEFRASVAGPLRTAVQQVGGIVLGHPVVRPLVDGPGRVVALVEVPFDLYAVNQLRSIEVSVSITGARVLSTWPRPDTRLGETVGVGDDLSLGPAASRLSLPYRAQLPGVTGGHAGDGSRWSAGDDARPLPTDGHRLLLVVDLPAGTGTVKGHLSASATILQRDGTRTAATPIPEIEISVPLRLAEPAAAPRFQPTQLPERTHLPIRGRGEPAQQVVSTGVSEPHRPDVPWPASRPLLPDTEYVYWFEVGTSPAAGAIDDRFVPLVLPPEAVPGTVLTVALFGLDGELALVPGADVGELSVRDDRTVGVLRQPGAAERRPAGHRLRFRIRTPSRTGVHRLRCNLYCGQTLLQSRLVHVAVGTEDPAGAAAVRSTTDYVLVSDLGAATSARLPDTTLSVFLNDDGRGSHSFRFLGRVGEEVVKADTTLAGLDLQDLVEMARAALRMVTWEDGEPWNGQAFRYVSGTEDDLGGDLIELACVGYRLWTELVRGVAEVAAPGSEKPLLALQALLRAPGTVEFASKERANLVVPVALIYDYLLDVDSTKLRVCADALDAIAKHRSLAAQPCFRGDCRFAADDTIVCPGGFWGFRHHIGVPQSRSTTAVVEPAVVTPTDGVTPIRFDGRPHCVVGVAHDFAGTHVESVCYRGDDDSWPAIDDRDVLLRVLRGQRMPHLVYLFCHGVGQRGSLAIQVGRKDSDVISSTQFSDDRIRWSSPRPLVVLNGCYTAAVEPRSALNFVQALIGRANAAGVVGTEVTVFPELAASFGDLLLDACLGGGETIGEAMRTARLALLAGGNPLGLVYTAYAAPGLRFEALV